MVYRVVATLNEYDHLVPDYRERKANDERFIVGPNMPLEWASPTLIYMKGSKKIRPNLMDYDQGAAFVPDDMAVDRLALLNAEWCRLVRVAAEVLDSRFKPIGQMELTLLAVTRLVDAVDRSRTTFKPYGDEIFLDGSPEETFFLRDRLPAEGLFHHKSGASTLILTYDDNSSPEASFRGTFEASGLTGLKFIPLGYVI